MIDPWFSLRLSLLVALLATAVVSVAGTALGFLLARVRFPGRDVVDTLCTLPLVLPPTVVGFFLLCVFARRGALGQYLYALTGWTPMFTWQAAVIAAVVIALPIMVRTSRGAIESVDTTFEKVAYTLGQSGLSTFFKVTLPLSSKGLAAGIVLTFTRALGEFGATLMLAGNIPGKTQTMPLAIYQATQTGQDDLALGLVMLMTITSFGVIFWTNRIGSKW